MNPSNLGLENAWIQVGSEEALQEKCGFTTVKKHFSLNISITSINSHDEHHLAKRLPRASGVVGALGDTFQ